MTNQQWQFVIGTPTTTDLYRRCRAQGRDDDFSAQFASEKRFESQFASPARGLLSQLRSAGCVVACPGMIEDFSAAFGSGVAAVTLVAHWNSEDEIELADGFHSWKEIARRVPDEYIEVLDLCVCHPDPLVRYLNARKTALVRHKPHKQSGVIEWLALYMVMASLFGQSTALTFEDAMVEAVSILMRGDY
jgi:hypothetical protein